MKTTVKKTKTKDEGSLSTCFPCRVCGEDTPVIFNIGLKAVSICESCANAISLQQVQDLIRCSQEAKKSYDIIIKTIIDEK